MIAATIMEDIFSEENEAKKEAKKLKKKYEKNDYYIQGNTSNISFLKVYKQLKLLGVDNSTFFLKLYDERLLDIDPHSKNLTKEEKTLVINECKNNIYYFLREVIRISVPGVDGGVPYILHRGNLALTWCIDNAFSFFLELPRQNGKSISIDAGLLWLYTFGTLNAQMLVMNKDHAEAKNNIGRIQEMRDCLPPYLQFDKKKLVSGEYSKISDKKESMTQPVTKNMLLTLPSAVSAEAADKLGRGRTVPFIWWDEFGYIKYNNIIYEAAAPAFKEAHDVSIKNGKRSCMMISTTPGDMNTDAGKFAFAFRNRGCLFRDFFYDNTPEEAAEILESNSDNGFFTISYQYNQLGKSDKYFNEIVKQLGNWNKVRREVLLEWLVINEDSPFDIEDIDELNELNKKKKPIRTLTIDKTYFLDVYKNFDPYTKYVIGVDVASGTSGDSSAIVIVDSKTKEAVATFDNNKIDTLKLSKVIHTIATQIVPNCVIAVERNNAGDSVLANLKRTDVVDKLYYEKSVNELDLSVSGKIQQQNTSGTNSKVIYGIWTDKKREIMFETLATNVKYYKQRFLSEKLTSQITKLIINKRGRIDHPNDGHDDLVMALNMAWWVIYNGKNRSAFGIVFYEDVDPESGLTETESREIQDRKMKAHNDKLAKMFSDVYDRDDYDPMAKAILNTGELKSVEDLIEEQRNNDRAYIESIANNGMMSNKGQVQLSTIYNNDNSSSIFGQNLYNSNNGGMMADDAFSHILDRDYY